MSQRYLIKNCTVVNEGRSIIQDVLISNGRIEKIGPSLSSSSAVIEINGEGKHLLPGAIDDQVHFREPGLTHKASIYSEAKAAVAGGVTSFMEMPNTIPPVFTQDLLEDKYQIASKTSLANYSFFMGTSNTNGEEVLKTNAIVETIAEIYKDARNALYLGRGYSFPVALEGALKLKEISYIHAEGYPAAEMKHGPIALIDDEMPVFVIATQGHSYEKVVSNIQEVKARRGKIIAIVTAGDRTVKDLADHAIEIPKTDDSLVPIISVIPLQLLAYHVAVMRGCNVDQPRNLAKSVTVE